MSKTVTVSSARERLAWAVAGLSLGLIFWATLMPSVEKDEILSPFTPLFRADKLGHLCGFGVLCGAIVCTGRIRITSALLFSAAIGVLTETLQLFVPGRSPLVADVLVDSVGAGLGVATVYAWRTLRGGGPCGPA